VGGPPAKEGHGKTMTAKLFFALYVGLIGGMIILYIVNFPVAWVFFTFVFVTTYGGILLIARPYLIASFFLAAGLIVLGFGLWGIEQAGRTSTWPIGYGVITRTWYCSNGPCIEYQYKANGQTFDANSYEMSGLAPGGWPTPPGGYQKGQEIKVHYDPANPGVSRLQAEVAPRDVGTAIIGGSLAALAAFTLVYTLTKRKRAPATAAIS
jgi:Protein of unknown function (DUF3592)